MWSESKVVIPPQGEQTAADGEWPPPRRDAREKGLEQPSGGGREALGTDSNTGHRDSPPDWICRMGRRPKPSTGSPRVLQGFNRNRPRAAIPGAPCFQAPGPTGEVGWTGFEDARLLDN